VVVLARSFVWLEGRGIDVCAPHLVQSPAVAGGWVGLAFCGVMCSGDVSCPSTLFCAHSAHWEELAPKVEQLIRLACLHLYVSAELDFVRKVLLMVHNFTQAASCCTAPAAAVMCEVCLRLVGCHGGTLLLTVLS
jgi:hypothetical protein